MTTDFKVARMARMAEMAPRARNALALYVQTHAPTILAGIIASKEWDEDQGVVVAVDLAERLFFEQVERYKDYLP